MCERNDAEVRPVRVQPHRGDDVFRVGGELLRREGDEPRRAAGGRGGFEVDAIFRWRQNFRRQLPGFERANNFIFAPRGEQLENKFRRMALRKNDSVFHPALFHRRQTIRRTSSAGRTQNRAGRFRSGGRRKLFSSVRKALSVGRRGSKFPPAYLHGDKNSTTILTLRATASPLPTNCSGNINLIRRRATPLSKKREPKPDYAHRCFVLVRAARQFLYHARFDADQKIAGNDIYRQLTGEVVLRNPRIPCELEKQIVIPGFASLREFSAAREELLKAECGGAWRSYFFAEPLADGFPDFARTPEIHGGKLVGGDSGKFLAHHSSREISGR
jgi:hypothetical protein